MAEQSTVGAIKAYLCSVGAEFDSLRGAACSSQELTDNSQRFRSSAAGRWYQRPTGVNNVYHTGYAGLYSSTHY